MIEGRTMKKTKNLKAGRLQAGLLKSKMNLGLNDLEANILKS